MIEPENTSAEKLLKNIKTKRRALSLGKYYSIYMKLTDIQKKQIEEDLNGLPENFLLFLKLFLKLLTIF